MSRCSKKRSRSSQGQATDEYTLLLALIAIAAIAGLLMLATSLSGVTDTLSMALLSDSPQMSSSYLAIAGNFIALMQQFYDTHGRWPRSWEPYNFSDIGLNPDDWAGAIDGIVYTPAGNRLGLMNAIGDNMEMHVTGLNGEVMPVYNGHGVWYNFADGQWYYHSISRNIPVDISSLVVTPANP